MMQIENINNSNYTDYALLPFKNVTVLDNAEEMILDHNENILGGWVYALSNESFPDLLKIGMTTISPVERAKQLGSSGVPTPFKVEWSVQVKDAPKVEKQIHDHFSKRRVNASREFFKITLDELTEYVSEEVDFYLSSGIDVFFQYHTIHLDEVKKEKRENLKISSALLERINCEAFVKNNTAFIESCVDLVLTKFRGTLIFKDGEVKVSPEPEYSGHSEFLKPHQKPVQIRVKNGGFSL